MPQGSVRDGWQTVRRAEYFAQPHAHPYQPHSRRSPTNGHLPRTPNAVIMVEALGLGSPGMAFDQTYGRKAVVWPLCAT